MRGRKIKCTFVDENTQAQEESKETPGNDAPDKYVGVDDADLTYKSTVTWQCMPHNIEVLFDSEHYFMEYEAFPELGPEEPSIEDSIVK